MESTADKLARLQGMADGDPTWDLSDNDMEAIRWVLDERQRMQEALKRVRQGYQNILAFRHIAGSDRYGALTREEVEGVIAEVDIALW
jgi:hypothetical protein